MSEGERIPREEATPRVSSLVALLTEHCDWIAPAGSYRREKADIGDVEIVAIAKASLLAYMDELVQNGIIAKKIYINEKTGKMSYRWGQKWRALVYGGIKFDLFLCDMDNRGMQYELRTGPSDKNLWMMTIFHRYKAPFAVKEGYIWDKSTRQKLHIPDEQAYFALLGIPYIEPRERTLERYQSLIKWGHVWGVVNHYLPAPSSKPVEGDKSQNNPYAFEQWLESPKNRANMPKKATPPKVQWDWSKPFLCDDGMVWVHIGYGKWAKKARDDFQTQTHLELYRRNPRSRESVAFTLSTKLHLMECEAKLTTAVQNCLTILRGVA